MELMPPFARPCFVRNPRGAHLYCFVGVVVLHFSVYFRRVRDVVSLFLSCHLNLLFRL